MKNSNIYMILPRKMDNNQFYHRYIIIIIQNNNNIEYNKYILIIVCKYMVLIIDPIKHIMEMKEQFNINAISINVKEKPLIIPRNNYIIPNIMIQLYEKLKNNPVINIPFDIIQVLIY